MDSRYNLPILKIAVREEICSLILFFLWHLYSLTQILNYFLLGWCYFHAGALRILKAFQIDNSISFWEMLTFSPFPLIDLILSVC